jgi:uncharacterized membrane protein YfcA
MPDASGRASDSRFLDTLGIGSFATTTTIYRLFGLVRDEPPRHLNVSHTLRPSSGPHLHHHCQVDFRTMALLIVAAVARSWLGASVAGWPRRNIQLGMGLALLVAAAQCS